MRKLIFLLSCILFIYSISNAQKNFTFNGTTVNLDKIPLNKALKISLIDKDKTAKSGKILKSQKAFASDNKKYVAIASSYQNDLTEKGAVTEGELKLYTADGKLLFQKKKENQKVINCNIGNESKFIHTVWSMDYEVPNPYKLISYDNHGNVVYEYDNVAATYKGDVNAEIIYFLSKQEENEIKLVSKNFKNNKSWEYSSNTNISIKDISLNGDYILFSSDRIYCMNKTGQVIFEKDYFKNSGQGYVSDNGNNILLIPKFGETKMFDTASRKLIFQKNDFTEIDPKFKVGTGCFIRNTEDVFAVSSVIAPKTIMIVFINTHGEIIDNILIRDFKLTLQMEIKYYENSIEIYFDGNKVLKQNVNW